MSYFPSSSVGKKLSANVGAVGDTDSIPELGRSSGEGNGNLLQYSCLESPMDRGAWWATVHGVAKSGARLSVHTCTHALVSGIGLTKGHKPRGRRNWNPSSSAARKQVNQKSLKV